MGKLRWKIAQSAEIRWWQRYLKTQTRFRLFAMENRLLENFFTTNWQYLPKQMMKVLDAGCGPAGIFTILKSQKVNAVSILCWINMLKN